MNKRNLIASLNGRKVQVQAKNWKDNEVTKKWLKEILKDQGVDYDSVVTETDDQFELTNGQFVFKEKRPKVKEATLIARSSFFTIDGIRFEYSSITNMSNNEFETKNSKVTWE